MPDPLVLLYHVVLPVPADADIEERNLYVSPDRFASQMEDLHGRGFRTVTLNEFRRTGRRRSEKTFLLTFDDGYAHVDETVTPVLRRFGFSAVMFAPWEHLGRANTWDAGHANLRGLDIASRDQLRRMDGRGWEVASHGLHHIDLTSVDEATVASELSESRLHLGELLGRPVLDLAYPYGTFNAAVRRAALAAGYATGFLAENVDSGGDALAIPRRPVRGDEGMSFFRIKTSGLARTASRLSQFTPQWVKVAARRASV